MRVEESIAAPSGTRTKRTRHRLATVAIALLAGSALLFGASPGARGAFAAERSPSAAKARFAGDRAETERFLGYWRAIELTAEQEAVRREALETLPAPCCKKFSAATCCCQCNMAKATWGLAKHLISEKKAGAGEVRAAVAEWHRAINPDGFSGDACFTGGCGRPFADNGCGGMKEGQLVF